MSEGGRASDLLLRWQEARRRGQNISATELCQDDPDLLSEIQRGIESLGYMESLLGIDNSDEMSSGSIAQSVADIKNVSPKIPGFEMIDLLDRGGMGVVYRARQRDLKRDVAVKMLAGLHCSADRIARFRNEAESVAQLQHPNIVQIYEVGECEGMPFYAMELVKGGTLAQQIANSKLSSRRAAEVVETLANGIHAAHVRGIVHRDLKPSNVLLTIEGTPKIADFGLAKRLEDDSNQTKTGEILGTPNYMAPEQAEGKSAEIGPAVDVYALGAILFEMLVGEPPFKSSSAMQSLRRMMTEEPVLPREVRLRVPQDLQAICLKCLEKSAGRRYSTAQLLADDVRRFLDGEPVQARPVGLIRRLAKWTRRRPELAVVSTVACMALVASGIFITSQYRQRQELRRVAVQYAPKVREILKRNCLECHGGDPNKVERNLHVLDHAKLMANPRNILVPGAPDDSRLIQRIADGSMPPEAEEVRLPRVSEQELVILRKWIAGGAPMFPLEELADPTPSVVPDSISARKVKQIFVRRCYECHKYDVADGGIKILNHRLLLTIRKVIVPGDPSQSELFRLVSAQPDDTTIMPPLPSPRLTSAEIEIIRQWIMEGAPPFPRGEMEVE